MKIKDANHSKSVSRKPLWLFCVCWTLVLTGAHAAPLGTAFTFSGRLVYQNQPANGNFDLHVALFDDATAGSQAGPPLNLNGLNIVSGLFITNMDFGSVFDGKAYWLEINARPSGNGAYTTLVPRLAINPAPYALNAANLMTAGSGPLDIKVQGVRALRLEAVSSFFPSLASINTIGGFSANRVFNGAIGATIAGGGYADPTISNGDVPNEVGANFGSIGGGYLNSIRFGAFDSTIGGDSGNTVNSNSYRSTISGGSQNSIEDRAGGSTIGGGERHVIARLADNSTIGGGDGNTIQRGAQWASIGGGRQNVIKDTGIDCTVAGGYQNSIGGGLGSTIGGGQINTIAGRIGSGSTISGGYQNAIGGAEGAAIGGGSSNLAGESGPGNGQAFFPTIGGGSMNTAEGDYSTIPGGQNNVAAGAGSFAAGQNCNVLHDGCFMWSDGTLGFATEGINRFYALATGGFYLYTGPNIWAELSPGGNSWSSMSDRNMKEHFEPVNCRAVLEKVLALPVTTWNLKTQSPEIRHIGAMAQDFKTAFAIGEDDRHISTSDADGVALAAIQGLNQKLEEQLKATEADLQEIKERNRALERRLGKLEALIPELARKAADHTEHAVAGRSN